MEEEDEDIQKRFKRREWGSLLLPLLAVLFLAVVGSRVSVSSLPASVLSQCRIVSSGVDIRSSRVCGHYRTKNVLFPSKKSNFRCRYDYYWTSVFLVEYRDHSLGRLKMAFSEAPTELLPLSCRPNFGSALWTKDIFKVNETYDCWYTSSTSKVLLYHDGFYRCQAERPTTVEMISTYFSLYIEDLKFLGASGFKNWLSEVIVSGVPALMTAVIVQTLRQSIPRLREMYPCINSTCVRNSVYLVRFCFLVAYFPLMGWLVFHYWKKLGLPGMQSRPS